MKRFLALLGSLLCLCLWSAKAQEGVASSEPNPLRPYTFQIEMGQSALSGVWLMREAGDTIYGSLINEFGVSAIDFAYAKRTERVKLLSVVRFLDKWYIRPTLKKDIALCVQLLCDLPHKTSARYQLSQEGDTWVVKNLRRRIHYSFTPILSTPSPHDTTEQSL